jgi:hypothetical protein
VARNLTASYRAASQASQTGETFPIFATITHPRSAKILRVVDDTVDYIYGGERFTGVLFDVVLLDDSKDKPTSTITLMNVDREIGEVIDALEDSPRLKLEVICGSQFSPDVDPVENARLPLGDIETEYVADFLRLTKVSVDAISVGGQIISFDYSGEPWPYYRGTKNRLPGLYR